jgi:hypothetical protein
MGAWLALLGTPLVSLGNLGLAYALVTPSCGHQTTTALHGVSAVSLAACAVLAWLAYRATMPAGPRDDGGDPATRRLFVARMAWWVALLFSLVTAAQWLCIWILSPCAS